MTITFETVDAPSKAQEKDVTKNPYWPVIEAIKDQKGANGLPQAAKFALPTEKGDDYKKATQRVRTKLNEISDHLGRTIRATFTPSEKDATDLGKVVTMVWVLDKKITRKKKTGTTETNVGPAETPAEGDAALDADSPHPDPTPETTAETPAEGEAMAAETPAETPAEKQATRRNRK